MECKEVPPGPTLRGAHCVPGWWGLTELHRELVMAQQYELVAPCPLRWGHPLFLERFPRRKERLMEWVDARLR